MPQSPWDERTYRQGLVEAAKTVAEMVSLITTAVVGVLKLFGLFLA